MKTGPYTNTPNKSFFFQLVALSLSAADDHLLLIPEILHVCSDQHDQASLLTRYAPSLRRFGRAFSLPSPRRLLTPCHTPLSPPLPSVTPAPTHFKSLDCPRFLLSSPPAFFPPTPLPSCTKRFQSTSHRRCREENRQQMS